MAEPPIRSTARSGSRLLYRRRSHANSPPDGAAWVRARERTREFYRDEKSLAVARLAGIELVDLGEMSKFQG